MDTHCLRVLVFSIISTRTFKCKIIYIYLIFLFVTLYFNLLIVSVADLAPPPQSPIMHPLLNCVIDCCTYVSMFTCHATFLLIRLSSGKELQNELDVYVAKHGMFIIGELDLWGKRNFANLMRFRLSFMDVFLNCYNCTWEMLNSSLLPEGQFQT